MSAFTAFAERCQMRHDYDDMIQVRYHHGNEESYDTWVSGEEVIQRLRSEDAEQQIRGLGRINLDDLRALRRRLPGEGKQRLGSELRRRLGDSLADTLGDNVLSETLAEAVRGQAAGKDDEQSQRRIWQARLQEPRFRSLVLALAYIQLEGSFPEDQSPTEPDDWV